MGESSNSSELTRFDLFGIASGIIGLVADVITISSLFIASRKASETSPESATTTFSIWVIAFLATLYSILIASFYARRIFAAKQKRKTNELSPVQKKIIGRGGSALTFAMGTPILVVFLSSAILSLTSKMPQNREDAIFFAMLVFGLPGSFGICLAVNYAAERMYRALIQII